MTPEMIIALMSGGIGLIAAFVAASGQRKATLLAADLDALRAAEERRIESETVLARYREPLARAAYDLQSRIWNILERTLIERYYVNGNDRESAYVVDNTAFLIGQYLAWTEIIRLELQFMDLGEDEATRKLARLQDDMHALFQESDLGPLLRLFAGEQRAIGERMIESTAQGSQCIGYATFMDRIRESPGPLIDAIRDDVESLSTRLDEARPRLIALQHALIDLIAFLDPEYLRFPRDRRHKVGVTTVSTGKTE